MKLTVNGEQRELDDGATLADLLQQLELTNKFVAVEINRELVPRAHHADRVVSDGDCIEIVTLVGGG